MPSDKTQESHVVGFVGFRNWKFYKRLTDSPLSCLDCKRETQAGYMDSSSVFEGPAQPVPNS